ncbi:MAG: cytochrome c [Steroidobacteraceae bacterium]
MKRAVYIELTTALLMTFSVQAQQKDVVQVNVVKGEKVYQTWCAACHAPGIGNPGLSMKPGADALRAKYQGQLPPILAERTDLTPLFVSIFVRQGVSVMPFFRKTEISDQELADLGAYLSRNTTQ